MDSKKSVFDNKLGMFIHWGIYAQSGMQEQVIARYNMTNEEYEKYALVFNPTEYDPAEWVSLAKNAGMKYICFTTKHHDGFCMWDTKYTDYNIMNTPYGRDVLKMLAEECEKQGMLLSLYYSCPDWHYEYGYNPNSSHQWKAKNKDNPNVGMYIEYVRNQIRELMTNYGRIYTLFWDIPPKIEDKSLNEMVRQLQPGIYINDRGFSEGDFSTPERDYDAASTARFERMTEACNSVGEQSWGYRAEEDYHSIRYLTHSIDRIMSMGGSYLLNVGPTEKGVIPEASKEIINRVGNWYNRMGGVLEKTEDDGFDYGVKKYKYIANKKNGKTYLHFYDGISSSAVSLKNYPSVPKRVVLMNNGEKLPFKVELLPEYASNQTGMGQEFLHIRNIPVNDFEAEPIVLEIEWS